METNQLELMQCALLQMRRVRFKLKCKMANTFDNDTYMRYLNLLLKLDHDIARIERHAYRAQWD